MGFALPPTDYMQIFKSFEGKEKSLLLVYDKAPAPDEMHRARGRPNRNADDKVLLGSFVFKGCGSSRLSLLALHKTNFRFLGLTCLMPSSSSFPNVASQHSQSDLVGRQSTTNLCSPSHTTVTVALQEATNEGPYHGPDARSLLRR